MTHIGWRARKKYNDEHNINYSSQNTVSYGNYKSVSLDIWSKCLLLYNKLYQNENCLDTAWVSTYITLKIWGINIYPFSSLTHLWNTSLDCKCVRNNTFHLIHIACRSYNHLSSMVVSYFRFVNISPPSAVYMRRWNESASVQILVCRLSGAKPSSKPMPYYCELDPWEQNSVKC